MSNPNEYIVTFQSKAALEMTRRGLKDLKELFIMRINEAENANDDKARFYAWEQVEILQEAMAAFPEED